MNEHANDKVYDTLRPSQRLNNRSTVISNQFQPSMNIYKKLTTNKILKQVWKARENITGPSADYYQTKHEEWTSSRVGLFQIHRE